MTGATHVIFGTGPVGCWTARALVEQGHRVRAVNRRGTRPDLLPAEVEVVAADVADPGAAVAAAAGAVVVVQALNAPYDRWDEGFPPLQAGALAAAEAAGARYVSVENLYMYDPSRVIVEDGAIAPVGRKGALRQRLAQEVRDAHDAGRVRAAALRSADYYGPGVTGSAWGDRAFAPLVAGKAAQLTGSMDAKHSLAYVEDVGRAVAVLATRDDLLGATWFAPHAPARTQRDLLEFAAGAAGVPPRASAMGTAMMRFGGLFVPQARAMVEMMVQFTQPFVVDASRSEAALGLAATPLEEGMARTVAWYREHAAAGTS
ncbi:MAG: NAD-dependent epimerase/dehydratase family protein [Trueperaceae bacterium]